MSWGVAMSVSKQYFLYASVFFVATLSSSLAFATDIPSAQSKLKQKPAATSASDNKKKNPSNIETGNAWVGPYVGLAGSYNLANLEFKLGSVVDLDGFGARGYGYGALIGYNFAVGDNQIISLEASGDYSDNRIAIGVSDNYSASSIEAYARTDWSGALSIRYGYLTTPNTMIFASLGATVTHAVANYSYVIDGIEVDSAREQDVFYGLAFGGIGMETRIAQGWHARLDYTENLLRANIYKLDGMDLSANPNIGSGRVSLIYSFGDQSIAPKAAFNAKWDGVFAGGSIGIDHGVSRYDLPLGDQYNFYLDGFGSNGISGRLLTGYNVTLSSNYLIGVEAEIKGSTSESQYVVDLGGGPTGLRGGNNWSYGAKARIGYLFAPETLGFVYGGLFRNASDLRLVISGAEVPNAMEKYGRNSVDFGVGLETFLTETTSARIDYGVSQYQKVDLLKEAPELGSISKFGSTGSIALITHF